MQTSRFFRELSDYNKAGPLETEYKPLSRSCCPQKHTLASTTAAAGLSCDVCRRGIAAGEEIYSCEPCDFDACDSCGTNRDGTTSKQSTRRAMAPPIAFLPTDLTTEVPEGNQALGRRLSVLWRDERPPTWFSGTIKQYNAVNNEHLVRRCRLGFTHHPRLALTSRTHCAPVQIVYADGDQRWHGLEAEVRLGNVEWLDRPAISPPADPPPPAKRPRSAPAAAPARKQRRAEASAPTPPATKPRWAEPKAVKPKSAAPKAARPKAAAQRAARAEKLAVHDGAKKAAPPIAPPVAPLLVNGHGGGDEPATTAAAVTALLVPSGGRGQAHSASLRGACASPLGPAAHCPQPADHCPRPAHLRHGHFGRCACGSAALDRYPLMMHS